MHIYAVANVVKGTCSGSFYRPDRDAMLDFAEAWARVRTHTLACAHMPYLVHHMVCIT